MLRLDGKLPRLRARLQGLAWKGKVFHPDGTFINQWAGFRAISSHVAEGPSWFDGRPCIVLEYPPGTAVFGNARDEIRQVGPNLWLGRRGFRSRVVTQAMQRHNAVRLDSSAWPRTG